MQTLLGFALTSRGRVISCSSHGGRKAAINIGSFRSTTRVWPSASHRERYMRKGAAFSQAQIHCICENIQDQARCRSPPEPARGAEGSRMSHRRSRCRAPLRQLFSLKRLVLSESSGNSKHERSLNTKACMNCSSFENGPLGDVPRSNN